MPLKPQILAAISGAIGAYLAEEEALLAMQATAALEAAAAPAPPPGPPPNLWGVAGRQWAMQMRLLAQRRSLK
jgi:hypothetical protein